MIILLVAASVVAGFLATHVTYTISEKRNKKIIKREEGRMN